MGKLILYQMGITPQISRDHSNVPITIAFLPDQFPYGLTDILDLFPQSCGFGNPHCMA